VRVGFPGGPRLEWYDRNPISQSISYVAGNVAPHSATTRATYTVPTGKKALIGGTQNLIRRATVAGTVGEVLVEFIMPGLMVLIDIHENNTVGSQSKREISPNSLLLEGDLVQIETIDESTGGTMDYWLYMTVTEIDA